MIPFDDPAFPLCRAAKRGDIGGVRAALAEAPWGEVEKDQPWYLAIALSHAVRGKQWQAVFYLIDAGAPLDYRLYPSGTEWKNGRRVGAIQRTLARDAQGCPGAILVELFKRGMKAPKDVRELTILERRSDFLARLRQGRERAKLQREGKLPIGSRWENGRRSPIFATDPPPDWSVR